MIALKTRSEIVEDKKVVASEIAKMQRAVHDEDALHYYQEAGEENLYWAQFDCYDCEIIDYKSFYKVIGLSHFDINTFCKKLAVSLIKLFQEINSQEIIIISHLKLDIFGSRENMFKPLAASYQRLEHIVGADSYRGGFLIDLENLPECIEILFWITRCDPCAPEYIYLFDSEEKIKLNVCKYGNIHLTEFSEEIFTTEKLNRMGWTIIEGREIDNFSDDNIITGRELNV